MQYNVSLLVACKSLNFNKRWHVDTAKAKNDERINKRYTLIHCRKRHKPVAILATIFINPVQFFGNLAIRRRIRRSIALQCGCFMKPFVNHMKIASFHVRRVTSMNAGLAKRLELLMVTMCWMLPIVFLFIDNYYSRCYG